VGFGTAGTVGTDAFDGLTADRFDPLTAGGFDPPALLSGIGTPAKIDETCLCNPGL
jgi:hypothetical protein